MYEQTYRNHVPGLTDPDCQSRISKTYHLKMTYSSLSLRSKAPPVYGVHDQSVDDRISPVRRKDWISLSCQRKISWSVPSESRPLRVKVVAQSRHNDDVAYNTHAAREARKDPDLKRTQNRYITIIVPKAASYSQFRRTRGGVTPCTYSRTEIADRKREY